MKKNIVLLALIVLTMSIFGQNKYEKAMGKAFGLMKDQKFEKACSLFERISQAEAKEWLPAYYVSMLRTTAAFQIKDKTAMDLKIKSAEKYLNIAKKRSPKNPEVDVIEGLLYTAKIVFNPDVNGQKYSASVVAMYKKALSIQPNNPRAIYLLAEFNINMSKYFPMDTTPFYKELERAIGLFDTFKSKDDFSPRWGKDRAVQILSAKPTTSANTVK